MLILSLVYYLVPCLAFTDYVGKWVDIPFFPLESSIQSPFGLALRQSEVTCPPTGVLCTDMTNCCPHGSSCCGTPPIGCCNDTTTMCFIPSGTGTAMGCCPWTAQTCGGTTCCQQGAVCCAGSPTGCCVSGGTCCGGSTCCGPTETCTEGVCQGSNSTASGSANMTSIPVATAPTAGGGQTAATSQADNIPTGVAPKSSAICSKLGSVWAAVFAVGSVCVVGYL